MYQETVCGPFKNDCGALSDGFLFIRSKEFCSNEEHWYLMPNGTFFYVHYNGSGAVIYDGTFDSSKYDDYVSQMKEYKDDWIHELSYETKYN